MLALTLAGCGGHVTNEAPNPGADSGLGESGADADAIADAPLPPRALSCRGRPGADSTCGLSGSDDCCATDLVPGGTFYRFHDGVIVTTTQYPATVSSFWLDRYEITVGRFRSFVENYRIPREGDGKHPAIAGSGWREWSMPADEKALRAALADPAACDTGEGFTTTWTDAPGPNEHLPMTCVTWQELFAFCAFDGGRLPTEAEWNYAGSGGAEQRVYPWSVPPTSQSVDEDRAVYFTERPGYTQPLQVGSRPRGVGRWGHHDLGGNVAEWLLDLNREPSTACRNCAIVDTTDLEEARILRGGGFAHNDVFMMNMKSAARSPMRTPGLGARCARDLSSSP